MGVIAEHEIMAQMQQSFEKAGKLESDVMSECTLQYEKKKKKNSIMSRSTHSITSNLVPVEEEALTSKFVWSQVLSENLARLAQNHFATRHYLTQQVLPVLQKDLQELHEYAQQLGGDEEVAAYEHWIEDYREVRQTHRDV